LGSALVRFALIWWITDTTNSALALTLAALVGIVPEVALGPFAGVIADRYDRRLIMIISDSAVALATLTLAVLLALNVPQALMITAVYGVLFIRAVAGVFHYPAMQASTSLMVPKDQLTRIGGFNQMLQGGMIIAAPPLGALCLAVLPLFGVVMLDVVTALIGISPLLFIKVPRPAAHTAAPTTSFWGDFRAGLHYVGRWPGMLGLLAVACLLNALLSPTAALQALLVKKHFLGAAYHLATLESTFGVGMIGGGILLSVWGGFKRRIFTSLLGIIGLGVGMVIVGVAPANGFWIAVGGMALAAVMAAVANGPIMAVMQAAIAPEMQGRVMTLLNSFAMLMSPLGLIVAGPVAERWNPSIWFILSGAVCVLMGVICFFIPAITTLEEQKPHSEAVANGG
jgi:DHA3 family macrolide efflux protein-like MFS transporter